MKAIVQDSYGPAGVLALAEVDAPSIGGDDVLVRVRASSVGAAVWHLMTGLPYLVRLFGFGLRRPKVRIPGTDVAGLVEAVGANVDRFCPGDEVFGVCEGAFAEYARARADLIVRKPPNLTFEQAAAVPDSGHTALVAVRDVGAVAPGQTVAVLGAGGGVGSFAVQLAKARGAVVTGVCSASKRELVESLGADHVIDYAREDFADGRRFDVIVDTAGRRSLSHLRRGLAARGTLVIVGGEGGGRWLGGTDRQVRAMLLSPFVSQNLRTFVSEPAREGLEALAELLASGRVTPVVEETYPLARAADAIRSWEAGHARGKIAVTV